MKHLLCLCGSVTCHLLYEEDDSFPYCCGLLSPIHMSEASIIAAICRGASLSLHNFPGFLGSFLINCKQNDKLVLLL